MTIKRRFYALFPMFAATLAGSGIAASEGMVQLGSGYVLCVFSRDDIFIENDFVQSAPGVPRTIGAIGWDDNYIVAETTTNKPPERFYWIIHKASAERVGPLSEASFNVYTVTNALVRRLQLTPVGTVLKEQQVRK